MIVSIAIAVLPVPRSPMISSRWPFADRDQRVDRADAGLQRLLDALALDDAGRAVLDRAVLLGFDRPFAVDRRAERVDDAAEQRFADRDRDDAAGAANLIAFLDVGVGAHDRDADVVLFEVEDDALDAVGELHQFRRLRGFETVDARDVVADFDDGADFGLRRPPS